MSEQMPKFEDLYSYAVDVGNVIPDYSAVKRNLQEGFKFIFPGFATEDSTPNGVLVDSLTMLCKDVMGVCAFNVNNLNIKTASGSALDSIGANFGVSRKNGESDIAYRSRILSSNGIGKGFVACVRNAVMNSHTNVKDCCILENSKDDTAILPNSTNGVMVAGHSLYVSVNASEWDDNVLNSVANAIYGSKSAGCGMTRILGDNNMVVKTITDNGSTTDIVFYKTQPRYVKAVVVVDNTSYTGSNISLDVKDAIIKFVDEHSVNYTIMAGELVSAVAAVGNGISVKQITLYIADKLDSQGVPMWSKQTSGIIPIFPYMSAITKSEWITVSLS